VEDSRSLRSWIVEVGSRIFNRSSRFFRLTRDDAGKLLRRLVNPGNLRYTEEWIHWVGTEQFSSPFQLFDNERSHWSRFLQPAPFNPPRSPGDGLAWIERASAWDPIRRERFLKSDPTALVEGRCRVVIPSTSRKAIEVDLARRIRRMFAWLFPNRNDSDSPVATKAPPGWKPVVRAGVRSDVGPVRDHNEDSYYVPGHAPVSRYNSLGSNANVDPTADMTPIKGPENLFVVADGMGGQLAGEMASQLAVETIPSVVKSGLTEDLSPKETRELIRRAMSRANEEILERASKGPETTNMGTTCVVALIHGDRAYVAGIGDSRVYRLRQGKLEQLTKDHSLAQALVDAGTLKPEEVATHKFNHVLYLYLGSREARDGPDTVKELELMPGDRFLLASDGLTGVVPDEDLARVMAQNQDPEVSARELVDMALRNQSRDNITCAVIHID